MLNMLKISNTFPIISFKVEQHAHMHMVIAHNRDLDFFMVLYHVVKGTGYLLFRSFGSALFLGPTFCDGIAQLLSFVALLPPTPFWSTYLFLSRGQWGSLLVPHTGVPLGSEASFLTLW